MMIEHPISEFWIVMMTVDDGVTEVLSPRDVIEERTEIETQSGIETVTENGNVSAIAIANGTELTVIELIVTVLENERSHRVQILIDLDDLHLLKASPERLLDDMTPLHRVAHLLNESSSVNSPPMKRKCLTNIDTTPAM